MTPEKIANEMRLRSSMDEVARMEAPFGLRAAARTFDAACDHIRALQLTGTALGFAAEVAYLVAMQVWAAAMLRGLVEANPAYADLPARLQDQLATMVKVTIGGAPERPAIERSTKLSPPTTKAEAHHG